MNVLITNNTPPRACLADFGFSAMIHDPSLPISRNAQLDDDTFVFASPELLVSSESGMEIGLVPTQEADIYAFGMVIFQVLGYYCGHGPFYFCFV